MTTQQLSSERYTFGGVDFSSLAVLTRAVEGADDLPQLRGEDAPFTGMAGRRPLGKLPDSKTFTIGLWVMGDDPVTEPTTATKTRATLDALLAVLVLRVQQALVRYMPDGSTRTAMAEVVSIGQFEDPASGELIGLAVEFLLADPWWYAAAVLVPDPDPITIAASPTAVSLAHPGSVPTHRISIDLVGPLSNPRITNTTTGGYVECLVTVAAGTHLVIDCEAYTALNDGANAIGSIRHSGGFPFLELVPGTNDLEITATDLGGTFQLTFEPPYL